MSEIRKLSSIFYLHFTSISNSRIPSVHQSTAAVCPFARITSAKRWKVELKQPLFSKNVVLLLSIYLRAMYSSVPTKEFVLISTVMEAVLRRGDGELEKMEVPFMMEGEPRFLDGFDKSKSDSIICPDSCNRISNQDGGGGRWWL